MQGDTAAEEREIWGIIKDRITPENIRVVCEIIDHLLGQRGVVEPIDIWNALEPNITYQNLMFFPISGDRTIRPYDHNDLYLLKVLSKLAGRSSTARRVASKILELLHTNFMDFFIEGISNERQLIHSRLREIYLTAEKTPEKPEKPEIRLKILKPTNQIENLKKNWG